MLKCNGLGKSLIEQINSIWIAWGSWNKLLSLKNTFLLWFTNAKYTAHDHKVGICKSILTFASVFKYEKENSEKTMTFTAGVSCSEEKMEDMKTHNAIIKLVDKKGI